MLSLFILLFYFYFSFPQLMGQCTSALCAEEKSQWRLHLCVPSSKLVCNTLFFAQHFREPPEGKALQERRQSMTVSFLYNFLHFDTILSSVHFGLIEWPPPSMHLLFSDWVSSQFFFFLISLYVACCTQS